MKIDDANRTKCPSFNGATSFIFSQSFLLPRSLSLFLSVCSTFISGSVHDILLVLVVCLFLQRLFFLSIYSRFRRDLFLIRSGFYRNRHTIRSRFSGKNVCNCRSSIENEMKKERTQANRREREKKPI